MIPEMLSSPLAFLKAAAGVALPQATLQSFETWWQTTGGHISQAVDRLGTPWLRMFDSSGKRVDEILLPAEYWQMLYHGYRAGLVWRVFAEQSLLPFFELGYLTSFYDPGLYCPYTVSLATAVALEKYATPAVKNRFLPALLRRDDQVWQGATWMTEIKGGSDLGAAIETTAVAAGDHWRLNGEKYFASNVGAELAVVAARPQGAPQTVRGLALFLLPQFARDGRRNYLVRRLKDKIATRAVPTGEVELHDSEAYLLGTPEQGIYLILEVLNLSRVANSIASVALLQRVLAQAHAYAQQRHSFGRAIVEHPLLRKQFEEKWEQLQAAFALAWESARLLNGLWRESPPYSDRHALFRLLAHLAKYWTAEQAVQATKWAMEVFGGLGTLAEQGVERWLREAMILQIWEGTPHRQILDGLEVIERKAAHRLLQQHLQASAPIESLDELNQRIDHLLQLPEEQRQAQAETIFRELAALTAHLLHQQRRIT